MTNNSSNAESSENGREPSRFPNGDCFVIMPISDPDGYDRRHFKHVFDDIFVPGCDQSGYRAVRADQDHQTNLIHLELLRQLLEAPMVLCDLSSRNPNVLFELGLRQAFDKPVVLVQEEGTPQIFDISPLRYTEYRKDMVYHEVLEDQTNVKVAIEDTKAGMDSGTGINSIVRLLSLIHPASIQDVQESEVSPTLQLILAELSGLKRQLRQDINRHDVQARHNMSKHAILVDKFDHDSYELLNALEHYRDHELLSRTYLQEVNELVNSVTTFFIANNDDLSPEPSSQLSNIMIRLNSFRNQYVDHEDKLTSRRE